MNREVCGVCWCPYDDAMRLPRAMAQANEAVA